MRQVEGVILKCWPSREADAIFELYTQEFGLMRFQAKGVRKNEAKLKFSLDIFNWLTVHYVSSRHLPIITDVSVKENNSFFKNDLKRLKLAANLAYILGRVLELGETDHNLWQKITSYFSWLSNPSLDQEEIIKLSYLWYYQLLGLQGFDPEVKNCLQCLRPIFEDKISFSVNVGGLIHAHCRPQASPIFNLNPEIILLSRALKITDPLILIKQISSWLVWSDFKKLTQVFYEYYFGIDLKTLL